MDTKHYRRVRCPGHPVASDDGRAYEHRIRLYDKIGPGPHACYWCEWPGLRWDLKDLKDPDYLYVDHLDGNGGHNDPSNLVPTHKWCNDNRWIIERECIPWDTFKDIAPADRPALRNTYTGDATKAAYQLAAPPTLEVSEPPLSPPPETETRGRGCRRRPPLRDGLTDWDAALGPPPSALLEQFPQLHRLKR